MSEPTTLEGYLAKYVPDAQVIELVARADGDTEPWPAIVVKYGHYAAVLHMMGLSDHMCVDVRAFVGAQEARSGVFGMENGRRYQFGPDAPGTSHKWPATAGVSILVGEQTGAPTRIVWDLAGPDEWTAGRWRLTLRHDVWILRDPAGETRVVGNHAWAHDAKEAAEAVITEYYRQEDGS